MTNNDRIVITGGGAICGAGRSPAEIWDAVRNGRSAIGPIRGWDTSGWPVNVAAEVPDYDAPKLAGDRKVVKLIRRTDVFGLNAAMTAIEGSGLLKHRETLSEDAAVFFNDRSAVFAGTSGGTYDTQYDYFPLLSAAKGSIEAFGRELENTVSPMWLLRSLPNNVLCHIGIRFGLRGTNTCITNHCAGGPLAVGEAVAAIRAEEADRAVVVGHDALLEPQHVLYYDRAGLLADDTLRPFDADRRGNVFGEGAGAMVIETASGAAGRGANVIGEFLGMGATGEAMGLLSLSEDGDGPARAIAAALDDAGIGISDVGMIVAHGNGTVQSDASEAVAIRSVFGDTPPPVTGFKGAFGHLFAAAGVVESLVALHALRDGIVPGIATLREVDPACAGIYPSREAQQPRSDIALVLSRGFAGTNTALVVRAVNGSLT
jgi:3-oxoacyl-[acyl-carrier-protein] synthase-1